MYSDLILDHVEHPRRKRALLTPTHRGVHRSSLCDDEITLELVIQDGVIQDAAWSGEGCCMTVAGASMLAERLVGMTTSAASHLEADSLLSLLGDNIPRSRQRCCLVAWNAMRDIRPVLQ